MTTKPTTEQVAQWANDTQLDHYTSWRAPGFVGRLQSVAEKAYLAGQRDGIERAEIECETMNVRELVRFAAENKNGSASHNAASLVAKLCAAAVRKLKEET